MVKKLLLSLITPLFFLSLSFTGYGQCPSSVTLTSSAGSTICEGTSVTFTASTSGGSGSMTFQWLLNGSPVGSGTQYTTNNLKNSDKVSVKVTAADGVTCSVSSSVISMAVNPERTPEVSLVASTNEACPGQSITFTATPTNGGTAPTYTWYVNNSQVQQGTQASYTTNSLNTDSSPLIRVVMSSNYSCPTENDVEDEISVTIKPNIPSSPGAITLPAGPYCPGQSYTFSTTGAADAESYVWSIPSGWSGNSTSTSITLTAGTSGGSLSVAGKNSCGTGSVSTASIEVAAGTPAQTSTIVGPATVCPSTEVTYSVSNVASAESYVWTFPNGWTIVNGENSREITFYTTTSSGSITVKAVNSCGTGQARSFAVNVSPAKPVKGSTVMSGNDIVCPGTSQSYSIPNLPNATSYAWTLPSGWTGNSTTNSIQVTTGPSTETSQTITVIGKNSCGESEPISLEIKKVSPGTPAQPAEIVQNLPSGVNTVCPNSSITFSVPAVAGVENYQWTLPSGWSVSGENNKNTIQVITSGAGNGTVSVKAINSCGTSQARTKSVNVAPMAPAKPGDISGPVQLCTGTSVSYSVPAVPNATSYTWTLPTGWTGTSTTNTIQVTGAATDGKISVEAVNSCGKSPLSSIDVVTVDDIPAAPGPISSNLPANNKTVCPPFSISFSVPDPGTYTWTVPAGWDITSGQGTNSIVAKVTYAAAYGTHSVSVVRTNLCKTSAATTFTGIEVNNHIVADIGPDQTVCKSQSTVTLSGTRSFGNANLETTFTSSGTGSFNSLPNGNKSGPFTIIYTPSAADKAAGSVTLSMQVPQPNGNQNNGNQCGSASDSMVLKFTPDATLSDPSNKNQSLCINSAMAAINFTVGGGASGATVTGLPAGVSGTFKDGTVLISGTPTVSGTFNYTVQSTGSCTQNQTSRTGILTVKARPGFTPPAAQTFCAGLSTPVITLQGSSITGTVYNWVNSHPSIGLAASGSGNIPSFTTTNSGNTPITATINVTPVADGCEGTPSSFTITVNPTPSVTDPADITVCNSGTVNMISLGGSNVTGTTYSWTNDNPSIGLAASGTGNIPQFTAVNNSTVQEVAFISITPNSNGCPGPVQSFSITVNPTPTLTVPGDLVLCNGEATSMISFEGTSTTGTTYSWTNSNTAIGLGASGTGSIPSFSATNTGTTPIEATITVTPSANNCSGAAKSFKITVKPNPVVGAIENLELCTGSDFNGMSFTSEVGGTSFSWTNSNPGIGLPGSGTGALPTFTPVNTGSTPLSAEISVVPTAEGCQGPAEVFEITVYPSAGVDAGPETLNVCSGAVVPLSSSALTGGATTAAWEIVSGSGSLSSTAQTSDPASVSFTPPADYAGVVVLRLITNDPEGPCTYTSDEITINVEQQVQISTQPSNIAVCTANPVEISVVATGDNLSYQWYKKDAAGDIPMGTSAKLNFSSVSSQNAGTYYVVVSGTSNCESVTSETMELIVDENIEVITHPQDQDVCVGEDVTLTVAATTTGGDPLYQWRRNGSILEGKTAATLNLTDVTEGDAGEYDVIIYGPEGFTCSTGYSEVAVLKVSPKPQVNAGADFSVCTSTSSVAVGQDAVVMNTTAVSWKTSGTGTFDNPSSLVTNYIPGTGETGTVTLSLTGEGLSNCTKFTDEVIVTISPLPVVESFAYPEAIYCVSIAQAQDPVLSLTNAVMADGGFTYTGSGTLAIDPVSGAITPANSTPGEYVVTYSIPSDAICEAVTASFTVKIGELPDASFTYDAQSYCRNTREDLSADPVISITEGEQADSFTYSGTGTLALDPATGGIDLYNSTAGTYTITRSLDYLADAEDGCDAVTHEVELVINDLPIPDFSYASAEYCSNGTNPQPVLVSGAAAGSFTAVPSGLVFSATVPGEIDLSNSVPGTYTVTNTIELEQDACSLVSYDTQVTITKLPVADFSYAGLTESGAICFSSLGISIATNPDAGGSFSSSTLGTSLDPVTGKITWLKENTGIIGTHTVSYTILAATGCPEVVASQSITIESLPVGGELNFSQVGRVFMTCENPKEGYAVDLQLSGHFGQVEHWEYRTSTSEWKVYDSQNESLSGTEIEGLVQNTSTVFRAKLVNGSCSSGIYSRNAIVSVIPSNIEPAPVQVTPEVLCYGGDISLSSTTGYGESFGKFDGGDFTSAGIKNNGWNFTDPNGNQIAFDASADSPNPIHWHKTQPKWRFVTANVNPNYETTEMWWNSSANSTDKNEHFAITQGTYSSNMDTPVFNLTDMDEAIVTFDQAYNLTTGAKIRVILFKNGEELKELYSVAGSASSGNYDHFSSGTPGKNQMSFDLGDYMGESGLQIRFEYTGKRLGDIWAVDNIKVPEGPQGVLLQWFYDENPGDSDIEQIGQDNEEVVEFTPRKIGWNDFEVKTALLLDSNGEACESLNNSETIRVFVFDSYTTTVDVVKGTCGDLSVELNAVVNGSLQGVIDSYPTADGYNGRWQIESPAGVGYSLSHKDPNAPGEPVRNPNIILEAESFENFQISWVLEPSSVDDNGAIIENTGCPPQVVPSTVSIVGCTALDFDGIDDYVDLGMSYQGQGNSIEAWIRPETESGTIISGAGFSIKMEDIAAWVNPNGRWYHIAVVGGELFVDGISVGSPDFGTGGNRTLIGATWDTNSKTASAFYSGWIEEVRIWKKAITPEQIRFLMNQHLIPNGTKMGAIIPMDVPGGLTYDDLAGYYRLISENPDPLGLEKEVYDISLKPAGGFTPDLGSLNQDGRLMNMTTQQENTAPLPYYSGKDGLWLQDDTWLRPAVWDVPNSRGADDVLINWNIVVLDHNIESGDIAPGNQGRDVDPRGDEYALTVLGLVSNKGTLTVESASGEALRVTKYLRLDGNIDLVGESQLLQDVGSIVAEGSRGFLEVDQQGTASSFNYNYWTSPVSPQAGDGSSPLNASYFVKQVMLDGTEKTPKGLAFGDAYAFADVSGYAPGQQKKVSTYWLHKFHGTANNYFSWEWIGDDDGSLNTGEGYSMKGTEGVHINSGKLQNYTFKGLPNNGPIVPGTIAANENYLIGNPYPSAIDANEFLLDNMKDIPGGRNSSNVFNGALYFWSHFSGMTHYLERYIGGYAVYNLSGGVRAFANDERIDNSNPNLQGGVAPQQFIPVGQGFFINTQLDGISAETGISISGGPVTFKNSQRIFQRESDGKSVFHMQEKKDVDIHLEQSDDTKAPVEEQMKIWLMFESPMGYHRQVLVTADPDASFGFDLGYDAPLIEDNEEDMYWYFNNHEFVIQGVSDFNLERELPLGIKVKEKGKLKIRIDETMNLPDHVNVYVADSLLQVVHDLRKSTYMVESEVGTFNDRFKIVFQDEPDVIEEPEVPPVVEEGDFEILYVNGTREILVRNPKLLEINRIYLNNLLGQQVHVYYNIQTDKEIRLPVTRFGSGVYVVKVHSEKGVSTKKVILE